MSLKLSPPRRLRLKLSKWERWTHEYSNTRSPPGQDTQARENSSPFTARGAQRRHIHPSQQTGAIVSNNDLPAHKIDSDFLATFLEKLPREIRDLVYTYVVGWTHSTYTIQTHSLIFRYPHPINPFNLLPLHLSPRPQSLSPHQLELHHLSPSDPAITIANELLTSFLSTNTFYLRYRYNPYSFSNLFTHPLVPHTSSTPGLHLRRLLIALHPPECPEDIGPGEDEIDYEYEWCHIFAPSPNGKCAWYRRRLDEDFAHLGRVLSRDCAVEVAVSEGFTHTERLRDGVNSVKRWLEGVLETWAQENGLRVAVGRIVD